MEKQKKSIFSTTCSNCNLPTAILLDYKKSSDKNLIYICQSCGAVFTKNNPLCFEQIKNEKKN